MSLSANVCEELSEDWNKPILFSISSLTAWKGRWITSPVGRIRKKKS